jgi:hypothetical protein
VDEIGVEQVSVPDQPQPLVVEPSEIVNVRFPSLYLVQVAHILFQESHLGVLHPSPVLGSDLTTMNKDKGKVCVLAEPR